jgi:hypothetical protein
MKYLIIVMMLFCSTAFADLTLTPGEGIDIIKSGAGGTVTVSGEDASTTNKGIVSFDADNFTVTTGAVTLSGLNWQEVTLIGTTPTWNQDTSGNAATASNASLWDGGSTGLTASTGRSSLGLGSIYDLNKGTMTDTKYCTYVAGTTSIVCNSEGGSGMTYPAGAGVVTYNGSTWGSSLSSDGSGDCASGAVCLGDHTHSSYLTSLSGAVLTDQSTPQTIGATGARLTKLWATDITATNAITGSVTGNAGTVTNGVYTTGAGTVFLAPNGSAASLTSFPTLNQNTTGTASGISGSQTAGNVYKAPNAGGTAVWDKIWANNINWTDFINLNAVGVNWTDFVVNSGVNWNDFKSAPLDGAGINWYDAQSPLEVTGTGFITPKTDPGITADPCAGKGAGTWFYNYTNDYYCYCNKSGVDLMIYGSQQVACF